MTQVDLNMTEILPLEPINETNETDSEAIDDDPEAVPATEIPEP